MEHPTVLAVLFGLGLLIVHTVHAQGTCQLTVRYVSASETPLSDISSAEFGLNTLCADGFECPRACQKQSNVQCENFGSQQSPNYMCEQTCNDGPRTCTPKHQNGLCQLQKRSSFAANESDAIGCVASMPFYKSDLCRPGFQCPGTCKKISKVTCKAIHGEVECSQECEDGFEPCVPHTSSGYGDPHLTGFDGSKFEFHGEHGAHFVLFGRLHGDLLVTKMRGVDAATAGTKKPLTYFHEFGIQPVGSNDQVRIEMSPCKEAGMWTVSAAVNGHAIRDGHIAPEYSVKKETATKLVVSTAEAEYSVKLMWPKQQHRAHLNLNVRVLRVPQTSDRFVGVLGQTLNVHLGRMVDADLQAGVDAAVREASLVKRFRVSSLFPERVEVDTVGLGKVSTLRTDSGLVVGAKEIYHAV